MYLLHFFLRTSAQKAEYGVCLEQVSTFTDASAHVEATANPVTPGDIVEANARSTLHETVGSHFGPL